MTGYYDHDIPTNKKKIIYGLFYMILSFFLLFLIINYYLVAYNIIIEDLSKKSIREKLSGSWILVKKEGFRDNKDVLGEKLKFGQYVRYTNDIFPKVINIVKENGSYLSHGRQGFYIRDPYFTESDMGYNLKILKVTMDTLEVATENFPGHQELLLKTTYTKEN
ncbi:hypothetical protein [Pedobacter punctiformis]|uniref:Uncharacterized protein n=1 Tax=Pedobacter punctiformis TaxID=3004097 RepID=A0ABT4L6J7_9SPHI|nr:hypothetical protein [Pedobacter sp. HCMS5-2]MCZ4243530.1 hypothetical protein [Pedobacter sp. HCMS5-2]